MICSCAAGSADTWENSSMKMGSYGSGQSRTSLLEKINVDINRYPVLAFVGGGGKTSMIFCLTEELVSKGKKVIVTTTTHMAAETERPFAQNGDPIKVKTNLKNFGYTIAACVDIKSGKLCGLTEKRMRELKNECDVLLVEADGSRKLPLKVPETWEPVIPDFADAVVAVIGLDALGKMILKTVHRSERAALFLGKTTGDSVAPDDIVKIASSEEGLKKNVGKRLYRVYLNKMDVLPSPETAECICRTLAQRGIETSFGSLKYEK